MKETSLLEVLLFLVTNHLSEKTEEEREQLKIELEEAGISLAKLVKIANWLKNLLQGFEIPDTKEPSIRIFDEEECEKIDGLARGSILFLERTGAINATMREWLIDQAMNLEMDKIGAEELQHLLSLVLFQQYGQSNLLNQNKSLIITNPQAVH